jgi:hypothetical protein
MLITGVAFLYNAKLTAASVGGVLSFVLAEIVTGQAILAGILALASAALAAWLASRPAVMQAKLTATTSHEQRAERLHDDEVRFLQERVLFHSQTVVLTRVSKHNVLEYCQEMTAYVHKLQILMAECGVQLPMPQFRFKSYDELCGEEDRALAMLALPADIHGSMASERSGEMNRGD